MQREKIKISYRGFEIEVRREKALGGWGSLYYTVMHEKDGWFLEDNFYESKDKITDFAEDLKNLVDHYYETQIESSKERIQRLRTTGVVQGFRSGKDGKILINPNDPREKEWYEGDNN